MKANLFCLVIYFSAVVSYGVHAQKRGDKQLSNRIVALSPEEQLKGFRLAPGFTIELVASEKDGVIKPIDLAFDDAGNLWTQTAVMYPLDPITDIQWNDLLELMNNRDKQLEHPAFKKVADLYKGVTRGQDKILKISGMYEGRAKASVWADGLAIPMSILPYRNAVLVAQGSEIFALADDDHDGKADKRIPLFTGFGFTDSHTMTHLLRKAPGNWVHFSHGALNKGTVTSYLAPDVSTRFDYSKIGRFSIDGKKIEVLNAGLNNIWGFTLRANGQWYGSEANDLGFSVVPLDEGAAFPGIGNEKFRAYQPFYPSVHPFRVGGTGLSGLAFSEDEQGGFPDQWKNAGFLANPITNSVNAVRVVQHPDGSITSEHLEDLLVSDDDWFRPVNISFGPDGCLYIADWYNKIVSHNEVPTSHPDRDKQHGRIWRIRHESQPARQVVDFFKVPTQQLPGYLASPYLWERRAAWSQIAERSALDTYSLRGQLLGLAGETSGKTSTRVHALWALESLGYFDEAVVRGWLTDPGDDIRREALRYLTGFPDQIEPLVSELERLKDDSNAAVRAQLIRTLACVPDPSLRTVALLVEACRPDIDGLAVGGAYERKFERYLARKALEQYPEKLIALLEHDGAAKLPAGNLLWAIQVLPVPERSRYYFQFATESSAGILPEAAFVELAQMASDDRVRQKLQSAFAQPSHRDAYVSYALKNQAELNTAAFIELLIAPVGAMLSTGTPAQQRQALDVTTNYGLKIPAEDVARVAEAATDEAFLYATVKALDAVSARDAAHYLKIVENVTLSQSLRSNALQGLIRTDPGLGKKTATAWLGAMDAVERRALTNTLSRHAASSDLVLELYREAKLTEADVEVMTAERIHTLTARKSEAMRLVEKVRQKEEQHKKAMGTKVKAFVPLATAKGGDPKKGELLFQTCLGCHQIGGKGQQIAPALDGLGYRDTEGLLYAVFDPDAAIEAGYALFRVVKKDNSVIDGYLVKRDNTGATLAFMGGAQVFVPASEIKSQYHVAGKSFMPSGLFDTYSEKDIKDILSFIKTIK